MSLPHLPLDPYTERLQQQFADAEAESQPRPRLWPWPKGERLAVRLVKVDGDDVVNWRVVYDEKEK